ncbi:hypothetical protein [Halomonas sp. 328]|uniref:hypothetical protein n=1 Tax=Halomonas sp. 328 TaxID=2776704 RepID=UPI001E64DA8A|nr:hypothetical protein [Halomonas sp. 328]
MRNESQKPQGTEPESGTKASEASGRDPEAQAVEEYLEPEADADALVQGLKSGQLTPSQQEALADMLVEDEPPHQMLAFRQQQTMYSGPLPHAEQFNAYDEPTRKVILQMAVDDQKHTHDMQKAGLNGAIEKDKRGQRYGLTIALSGLLAAAIIAPFSPWVAGIIGALDLFGMVALFVAPRVLEGLAARQQATKGAQPASEDDKNTD